MKAIKTIAQADVIIYDALVNEELLEYAKDNAVKHFAGKRMGCHSLSQQEINFLIADYSSKYERIVRLKGGDPFVFGRAHEEIEMAKSINIEIEIICGISSCIAAPASQMIPLTCRGISESFWVATGTTRTGEIAKDIYLAAKSSATIVILMAMNKLEEIVEIFLSEGKADLPAAVIQHATTANEKMAIGKVKDIAYRSASMGLSNPAVIIIGEVVNLHYSLNSIASTTNFQKAILD